MTYPRAHLVDAINGGTYHCISRCVRRSWLCGFDTQTGRDLGHRRRWLEERIVALSRQFAVDLFGYAVMSNHYHVVIRTEPRRVHDWSDAEVARRWVTACHGDGERLEQHIDALLRSPGRIAVVRERLGSLSWFMRFINEPLARMANREDGVTGRFWEGRFRSVALLDEAAVVACMAYVDLNPVRAGMVEHAEEAPYVSVSRRVAYHDEAPGLVPLGRLGLTLPAYVDMLRWGADETCSRDVPTGCTAGVLAVLGLDVSDWRRRVEVHRHRYRAYGALPRLVAYAASIGQQWLCGARAGMAAP